RGRLRAAATVKERAKLTGHTKAAISATFSRDGKTLATCGFDGLIKLWDVAAGKEKATLKTPAAVIHDVVFSPDGKTLAAAYNPYATDEAPLWGSEKPGAIQLWDVATGKERQRFRGPRGKVTTRAFSADGQMLPSRGS